MARRNIYVGTSGWTYDDWSGPFYPSEVKGSNRLIYYAKQFNTVEVNVTFYRLPTQAMIDAWNRNLKRGFHLVVKGSRIITHMKKLRGIEEPVKKFLDRALGLEQLKVVLWQLPPNLRKDVERLDQFLGKLPGAVRHAVEFRHDSWWDEEVDAVLKKHGASFVAVSHPELPDAIRTPTDFLYVRFHGLGRRLYNYDYSKKELGDWVRRLKPHLRGRKLYAFFNNDWYAHAPKNAALFRELLAEL